MSNKKDLIKVGFIVFAFKFHFVKKNQVVFYV